MDDVQLHVFLEVDRATERPAAFARKIAAYLEWYWSGRWREHLTIRPLVVVVTPTVVRATSLRRTTETVLARYGGQGIAFDNPRTATSTNKDGAIGWGGRIRTSDWLIQNQLPYRLATPQRVSGEARLSHQRRARALSSPERGSAA
jgi:hypothetical protein